MSVSVTDLFTEHSVVVDQPAVVAEAPDEPWYDGLTFSGPLDPAGSLFAFLLALVATVGVVVLVAGVVRIVSGG
jgi:hypothetical protein